VPFNPNVPLGGDLLSNSQADLLNNNGFLNTWSGTDHYPLNDATSNNGKHQVLQMPAQATKPVTSVDPMFYSFAQPTGNQGTLQYVQGVSPAAAPVQSPITPIQSSATGISLVYPNTATIFDFTGSIYCIGYVNAGGNLISGGCASRLSSFIWNGSVGYVQSQAPLNGINFQFSGALLQIIPNIALTLNQVAWTLNFSRIFSPT
jgi:hypothetical protein